MGSLLVLSIMVASECTHIFGIAGPAHPQDPEPDSP
jgi:hypothetical protein